MSTRASYPGIARIDIAGFRRQDAEATRSIVESIRAACEDVGFLILSGHGIPATVVDEAFAVTARFFDLNQAEKDRWHPEGLSKQRGYHRVASRGLAYTLDNAAPPDLRESLFMGPIDDHRASYAHLPQAQAAYWPNTTPTTPINVQAVLDPLYREFERLSSELLQLFALTLSMPPTYFTDKIDQHFSILGCHHYPALTDTPRPGQLRTGAHTDFGAMTILAMTDADGGLEAQMPNGDWTGVKAQAGELVVNIGDMLARWTNDRWASTLHRVINPAKLNDAGSRRQSIGYFMHPNFDARVECFPSCLGADDASRYAVITAGEHILSKINKSHGD
ncbi:MAG: isopenicillin N synthase family oxygenase [Gammaproteobacteria bacterium]|nr:isopenicillin N synthase family oxygenase [Gammaproteobacteria bacterium]